MAKRPSILIVDDQPANLLSLEALLSEFDADVVRAQSGEEALRATLDRDFALILMDVMMPGMDGIETASLIRSRPHSSATPLIFVTAAMPSEQRMFRGYSVGAVDYLFKPIVPEILRSKVGVFLDLHRKGEEILGMKARAHERELAEMKRELEAEHLRTEMERERRTSAALKKLAEELTRSNRDLEQFAYVASHDLKEPLRTVNSYLYLIEKRLGASLDEETKEYFEFAKGGARRMAQLVDDLLAYSKVGRGDAKAERIECEELVGRVLLSLKAALEESGAEIVRGSLPELVGQPLQVAQVFQNLIGNALKYRRKGVTPRVEITATPHEGQWLFQVKDNGIGFEMQYAERIFLIFQRLHGREEFEGGTGVGLALCKKIVERHGGKIWATSVPGEGSSFFFTLPGISATHDTSASLAAQPALS